MKVLAIDPGYERLGLAVLEKKKGGKEEIRFSETFRTSSKTDFHQRLLLIGEEITKIIKEHQPDFLAIEKLFFNTNQKTATNVSEVRGAILFLALQSGLEIKEYTPLQIKSALTGDGRADKKQVLFMLSKLISIKHKIRYDDEYDAIACGLTFFAYHKNNPPI